MNRRGFLSMLAALGTEPLIPKGTAFSFLGGIYRPAWVEVPAKWPLHIELRGRQVFRMAPGTYPAGYLTYLIAGPDPATLSVRGEDQDQDVAATISGICAPKDWKNGAQLLRNREGDYLIQPRPSRTG